MLGPPRLIERGNFLRSGNWTWPYIADLSSPFDHRQHHLPCCPQNGRCISLSHTSIRFPNPSVVRLLISGKIIFENATLNTSFAHNKLYAHIVRDVFSLSSLL